MIPAQYFGGFESREKGSMEAWRAEAWRAGACWRRPSVSSRLGSRLASLLEHVLDATGARQDSRGQPKSMGSLGEVLAREAAASPALRADSFRLELLGAKELC